MSDEFLSFIDNHFPLNSFVSSIKLCTEKPTLTVGGL